MNLPGLKIVLASIETVLKGASSLSYFGDNVYSAENILDLLNESQYPLINIDLDPKPFRVVLADNIHEKDCLRFEYHFHLQYATINESKRIALLGNDETKGLLDIHDDLYGVLMNNKTLNGTVYGMKVIGTDSQVFSPDPEKILFIAGADTVISYWIDVNLR